MQGALEKVSSVPLDQLDPQVKIWANEVRELSYAIEDNLDSFVTRVKGGEPTKTTIKNLLKKAHNKLTKFNARHELADEIKDIESQVREIRERYGRYKIDDIVANVASTTVDPRLSALYKKVSDLVGIDEPIEELMKVLSEDVETSQKDLKIVSIVGFGGLGKTTLAKALYDKLSNTYQCKGFVPVGQNQGTKKVLRDILLELDMALYRDAATMDERQLINQVQKFLAGKRYFIVIDDLWDIPTWKKIKFAFVDSHPESRIIVTTRILDVATDAGGIYHMKPLSNENSKMLFHTRTCGPKGASQDSQPGEVINKILKKCGGVPLAIITIASLLVGKPSADWCKVYDAIGFGNEDSEVIQNTRKILSFSYYDLPSNLKACLLYLSMFPEDYFIEKKSLIWRWVIEGFVLDREGIGSYELGEIYFNKLVNKSMIQFTERDDKEDKKQGGCRVHDMVLDFIRTISNDINFVTFDDLEHHTRYSRGNQTSMIHRLALHERSGEHSTSIQMEHVRSFNAIMCGAGKMPLLSRFKVLRVLVIEGCNFSEGYSLEHLGKLVQLRYLGLVKTAVKLPEGIGHDLKFLEVLDVRGGLISELPLSICELHNLRCLWADEGTVMKGMIGKLTSLEELQIYSVEECPNLIMELGKLTHLRVLKIWFDPCEQTAVAGSLCKLHKIENLNIRLLVMGDYYKPELHIHVGSIEDMALGSRLCFLSLMGIIIPRVPSWISSSCVPLLSNLRLFVEVVEAHEIQTLGRLPWLSTLTLLSKEKNPMIYIFGSDEFQKLDTLVLNIEIGLEEGALPRLECLMYSARAGRKESLVPWSNSCPLLTRIICGLDCANAGWHEVKAAHEILRNAKKTRPYSEVPGLNIEADDYDMELHENADAFVERFESIQLYLEGPVDEEYTAVMLPHVTTSLEDSLSDADDPVVIVKYAEEAIRGYVAKFKNWLHDHAEAIKEEEHDGEATSDQQEGASQS